MCGSTAQPVGGGATRPVTEVCVSLAFWFRFLDSRCMPRETGAYDSVGAAEQQTTRVLDRHWQNREHPAETSPVTAISVRGTTAIRLLHMPRHACRGSCCRVCTVRICLRGPRTFALYARVRQLGSAESAADRISSRKTCLGNASPATSEVAIDEPGCKTRKFLWDDSLRSK